MASNSASSALSTEDTDIRHGIQMGEGTLLVTGRIFTGTRFVESIVVRDGRIAFAGPAEDASRMNCERTIHHDGVVIPGLIDSHMHLAATGLNMLGVDIRGSESINDLAGRAGEMVNRFGFAVASGWDQELFREKRYPTARDMDAASCDRPVILYRFCSHAAVVNTHVLRLTGVDRHTPDPEGGIIGRDASGEPDGMFFDTAIEKHVYPVEAGLTRTLGKRAVKVAADYAVTRGLTTLMPLNTDRDELEAIAEAWKEGGLKCRLRIFLSRQAFESSAAEVLPDSGGMLRISGLKLFADGAFGSHTALLSSPYNDMDTCGLALTGEEEMERLMRLASEKRMLVAVHAIGDKAAENVLNAAARLGLTSPEVRIEHIAYTPHEVLELLTKVRPTLVVQPHFLVGDWWLTKRLGERSRDCYMFRTYSEMGLTVVGSSDSPVEPLDPWTGILAATDRGRHAGVEISSLTAKEAIDIVQAVCMYTVNAGQASAEGGLLGTLEQGAFADAVFMDGELDAETAKFPAIAGTMVGGRIVYAADGRFVDFSS